MLVYNFGALRCTQRTQNQKHRNNVIYLAPKIKYSLPK